MAVIYKRAGGRKVEQIVAMHVDVQDYLERLVFEMKAQGDVMLIEHRVEGHAELEIDHGDIDWYLTLSDDRGDKAALSIEFGRAGFVDPETGEEFGAMDGLFILHKATGLTRKARAKIRGPITKRRRRKRTERD